MQMPKGVTKGVGDTIFFFLLRHQKQISEPSWNEKKDKKKVMGIRREEQGR